MVNTLSTYAQRVTMEEIYQSILLLINNLTKLSGVSHQCFEEITEENGEELIRIVNECEYIFVDVKKHIAGMVKKKESNQEENIEEN